MQIEIYSEDEIEDIVKDMYEEELNILVTRLDFIGMQCVNEAKQNGDYKDHTSNLRNSIEYAVIIDGKIVKGGGKHNGFAIDVVEGKQGIYLVLLAGMEYASLVEYGGYRKVFGRMAHTRPYNVIASAELLMEKLVNELYEEYE